ncbi:hypothetical protein Sjap_025234 [Stephania japonica]|uniref:RNI-like superfamily protein n=1 Tax=Stephania japonica TaxID=461633 RepID=A0AAP0HE19_9MAGN
METKSSESPLTSSLQKLNLVKEKPKTETIESSKLPLGKMIVSQSLVGSRERPRCPSLVSLCIGFIGRHFEDIVGDLDEIAACFPSDTKMIMMAIARRRQLLNDEVLIALADCSWDILDISGSDVSDVGLMKVGKLFKSLRAVDISRCRKITALGVSDLLSHCHSLEILRCGGCPRSDATTRRCLDIFKPKLDYIAGETWEELDSVEIVNGAQLLRWLVWPNIDRDSQDSLATECPRIILNPKPSPFGFRGVEVPNEALPDITLDGSLVKGIDPRIWAVSGVAPRPIPPSLLGANELPMAERFRLAFVERDMKFAPKRAKNARQNRRRAEREWVMTNTEAKSVALASELSKSVRNRG